VYDAPVGECAPGDNQPQIGRRLSVAEARPKAGAAQTSRWEFRR
jgi:hypothetical protein